METIFLEIEGKKIEVPKDITVLAAAKSAGINIPTLCNFRIGNEIINDCSSCRICVVEIDDKESLFPSCSTKVQNNMKVKINSPEIMKIRRGILELILSNHPNDCLVCQKSGECELQKLAQNFGLKELKILGEKNNFKKEISSAIVRDSNKCIMCRRCEVMCNNVQTCGVISASGRGFKAIVSTFNHDNLEKTHCTFCGQCVAVCPVGALQERDYTWSVRDALAQKDKIVVAQLAPAVRVALGESFGLEPGKDLTLKIVTALKKMGFDYVFDTTWAADLTIMEEAKELQNRLEKYFSGDKDVRLPLLTSCCPAWVNFIEYNYQDMLDIPSTSKSPQQMFSSVIKELWTKEKDIKKENVVVVSIMPCLAKKYEAARKEFSVNEIADTNISITTRELVEMIKMNSIDILNLEETSMDEPFREISGAGVIFGRTGGVIEAVVRTVYEWMTKEELEKFKFDSFRGNEGLREITINIKNLNLNIGIAHGLGNARKLLDKIKNGEKQYHVIEIMACNGGCVGGGGQPYHRGNKSILEKRIKGLNEIDNYLSNRKSHKNNSIIRIYQEYLIEPLSKNSEKLLHTKYFKKK